jgi:hypothetical protein
MSRSPALIIYNNKHVRADEAVKGANLDVVQVLFVHGLELGNTGGDARQIMLDRIFWAP